MELKRGITMFNSAIIHACRACPGDRNYRTGVKFISYSIGEL